MAVVLILPLVLILAVNVAITYSKVRETLDAVPASAAVVSRQAIYAVLVGAARYGVAAGDAFAYGGADGEFLDRSLSRNPGYAAIRVRLGGATRQAVREADRAGAKAIMAALDAMPNDAPDLDAPNFPARAWFRPLAGEQAGGFGVRVRYDADSLPAEVDVVVSPDMMRRVLESVDNQAGAMVTLLDARARPLSASASDGWLPTEALDLANAAGAAVGMGRDGQRRLYGVRALAGPHAYVVTALDVAATSGLRAQLPIAFLVPVLGLALITLAFMRAMKINVLDWIFGLDRDVRRSRADAAARAVVSTRMPIEIENVARSFNDVLDARNARENDLSNALARNRMLTRELHHRVKNSLQLVQSYLALGARDAKGEERMALAAAQCRAYILSSAYRRALAEGEMRPFEIDPFLADVGSYASEVLKASGQRVEREFSTALRAGIDEALPLGMIVVELIERGLRAPQARVVCVEVRAHAEGGSEIVAASDATTQFPPAGRLLIGLLRQIGARGVEPPEGYGAAYRFQLLPVEWTAASRDPTHAQPSPRAAGNPTPPATL